jgi:hypothetical protein
MQDVESMLRKLGRAVAATEANGAGSSTDLVLLYSLGELGEGRAPRAHVLDQFSWIKIMNSDSSVYVFVSADGAFRGLSRLPDGVNLPQTDGIAWLPNDTIPLTLSALGKFVENSDVAMADLIMRGYYIVRRGCAFLLTASWRRSSRRCHASAGSS